MEFIVQKLSNMLNIERDEIITNIILVNFATTCLPTYAIKLWIPAIATFPTAMQ